MNLIKRKLNNKDGATLLIILVGLLVAIMISVVILTASVTSAKRVANDKKTNQAHLTLESAAQLVRDGMEGTTYTFTKNDDEHIDAGTAEFSGDYGFDKEMKKAVEYVDTYTGETSVYNSDDSTNFTVKLDDSSDDQTVNVSFLMKNSNSTDAADDNDDKYDVTFTLTLPDSDEELYLAMNGSVSEDNDNPGTYTISWEIVSINELGA